MPADNTSFGFAGISFTPTWEGGGGNPAIGNGTISGRYVLLGNVVVGTCGLTAGSTTTFGSGTYYLGVPLPMRFPMHCTVSFFDNSASQFYIGIGRYDTAVRFAILTPASPAGFYSPTVPVTMAQNDQIHWNYSYEIAA